MWDLSSQPGIKPTSPALEDRFFQWKDFQWKSLDHQGSPRAVDFCWKVEVTSDSLWPHRLYSPWNSPGQNTGVGSLSLLQGNLPNPGIEPRSPALRVDSLPAEPQGKPKNTGVGSLSFLQEIFLTQESNWGLLHCRQILYQLSYQGSPLMLEHPVKLYHSAYFSFGTFSTPPKFLSLIFLIWKIKMPCKLKCYTHVSTIYHYYCWTHLFHLNFIHSFHFQTLFP